MKVLCFADTRFPIERANGRQTMATCRALAGRGHAVRLVTRPDTASPPRDPFAFYGLAPHAGLRLETVGGPRGRAGRLAFLLAAARRAAGGADVVYTRDLGVAAWLLRLPAGCPPLVYESHGVSAVVAAELPGLLGQPDSAPSAAKLGRLDRRERRVWRGAGAVVAITRALAEELEARHGPGGRVFVVPDGADAPEAAPAPPDPAAPPVAGYSGHLYPWKGVDVFVRALALAPGLRGLIVGGHPGEADLARVEALARDLGVAPRLEVTGLVPPADVAGRLARAAILVLPNPASAISERYTSPLKLFEYLALGRPIVASDLAAFREVLTPDRTALFVPPGDPAALAAALERLAGDPALAASLGAAARALAPEYTWARRAERLDAALEAARGR